MPCPQFHPECNHSLFAQLLQRRARSVDSSQLELEVDFFNSAVMLYDTAILGYRNRALKGIIRLYHEYGVRLSGIQTASLHLSLTHKLYSL